MKLKNYYFFFFLFAFFFRAMSQEQKVLNFCATPPVKSEWLTRFQQNGIVTERNQDDWLLVPLTVHLVGNDDGQGYFSTKSLLDAFCTLNADFLPAKIRFYIKGPIRYIPNSAYNNHTFSKGYEMMQRYSLPNTINSYIVEKAAESCGYANVISQLGVALSKSCMKEKDHTWAHEIGHLLSLPHTFHGWEGQTPNYSFPAPLKVGSVAVERVDKSNCKNAGDGFCDTSPDYLNDRWTCNLSKASDQIQIDPTGQTFTSDGTNFMAYSNDPCMTRFSEEQLAAMRANLITEKSTYLTSTADTSKPISTDFIAITPADSSIITEYKTVTLSWQPIAKATHYIVEVSSFADFPFILFRYFVSGTNVTTTELFRNRNYYWRVRPINAWSECNPPATKGYYFRTLEITNTTSLESITDVKIFPNPANSGSSVKVQIDTPENQVFNTHLVNLAGQVLQRYNWKLFAGENNFELNTEGLVPGLYLIRMSSEYGIMTRRILVTD
jgi:hypothetical protein